jgi:uncharacterized membrane protein
LALSRQQKTLAIAVAFVAAAIVFLVEAPGSYPVYKAIHVTAAVIWIGGAVLLTIFGLLAERENDPVKLGVLAQQASYAGERIFGPASVVLVAFGFALMGKGGWDYGSFWVIFGLLVWIASAGTGFVFFMPRTKRLKELITSRGVEDAEVQSLIKILLLAARLDAVLLLLAVVDMSAKPFL